MATISEQKTGIKELFNSTRKKTLELVQTLEKDDYVVQTAFFMSPPKWHIGHVSWLFEIVMSKTVKDYEFYSEEFSKYLNSYYRQFGTPHDKGKRGIMSRPTTDQLLEYHGIITDRVNQYISSDMNEKKQYLYTMAINHECQHQELLVYDLQHLLADRYKPVTKNTPPVSTVTSKEPIKVKGGIYEMGYSGNDYCYDIELPEHKVYLNDYTIDPYPVTNQQYMKFIEDGGYDNFKHWLSDGWEKVNKEKWTAPLYWEKIDGKWHTRDFTGLHEIELDEPVCHVSYYEASAYCKWAKKRLPTEAEWEKAALWNDEHQTKTIFPWGDDLPDSNKANLLESNLWKVTKIGTYPEGKSKYGCHQMIGDVWEWTSSEFMGYPGFKTGFSEYNDKWFTNQKVLRGGSFGTPEISIRGSYRNFFRLDERWLFAGFRCAQDT